MKTKAKSAAMAPSPRSFDAVRRAARHALRREIPATNFFEGAVLGNGRLGVIATTRPDSVKFFFGHNSVIDRRAAHVPLDQCGTFEELWSRYKSGDRTWLEAYNKVATGPSETHAPRPWSCGSLLLGFDRRDTELLGHTLHLDTALLEIRFLVHGRPVTLQAFIDSRADRLWLHVVDARGQPAPSPFLRLALTPHDGLPARQWHDSHQLAFRQILGGLVADAAHDHAFVLSCRTHHRLRAPAPKQPYQLPPANLAGRGAFFACVELTHGLASEIPDATPPAPRADRASFQSAAHATRESWQQYWRQSGVLLDDDFLEETWYRNQYFLHCATQPGALCPTLYGNWPVPTGAPLWSGEYVMDYNAQQVFWSTFSSNHLANNLPYADMIDLILPVAQSWARHFYQLPGAFIAQRHWPVATPSIPVPWFGWGNHLAPVAWAVQGLWWHYLYSMDREFLRMRAFGPIREVVLFLNAYLRRPDAHGPTSPWQDNKFHVHPTQSPEIWPEHFGEPAFSDAIADLALIKFTFRAYLDACRALDVEASESALRAEVEEILAHFPEYPQQRSPRGGRVWTDVTGATPDAIYNVPNPLLPVFPGEEHGLHSPPETYALAANTWRHQQNEGGNDLVFLNLQGARLGLLDLEKFKRQLRYCQIANGTFTDMTLQAGGRYDDAMPNDYMKHLGIWIENFALPVVLNECLLQSYSGELRFFPNWKKANGRAQFQTLRAVGAFLVSACFAAGKVQWIRIKSEAGQPLRLVNPWGRTLVVRQRGVRRRLRGTHLTLATRVGETLDFTAR
ncbi:hypothetical protein K0B96_00985 [Horticoccus luteus]|uniref:Glycosyl hydrolase family 95 catalytic domain-containing protein n=1 Tax=Horticoccus luteus TaxID=2862869 RepID=A0A8F9TWC8_9BACT|nr:hypothetical protein [Horticoccus luteus]QYM79221.1 hypothetical protein K0B96_00985 [Horticoccus luteus]